MHLGICCVCIQMSYVYVSVCCVYTHPWPLVLSWEQFWPPGQQSKHLPQCTPTAPPSLMESSSCPPGCRDGSGRVGWREGSGRAAAGIAMRGQLGGSQCSLQGQLPSVPPVPFSQPPPLSASGCITPATPGNWKLIFHHH